MKFTLMEALYFIASLAYEGYLLKRKEGGQKNLKPFPGLYEKNMIA